MDKLKVVATRLAVVLPALALMVSVMSYWRW